MTTYYKFPRIYHVPWSESLQNDDKMHGDIDFFTGKNVIATIKFDGENTNGYPDLIHARSVDSKHHESRNWVKAYHGSIKHLIPEGYRITGENLYATHSIHYTQLENYFYLINVWNGRNIALSWEETQAWAEKFNTPAVPEFYQGVWDRDRITTAFELYKEGSVDPVEGYVVRIADEIPFEDYSLMTAKMVRRGHVTTSEHWMSQKVIPNELRK